MSSSLPTQLAHMDQTSAHAQLRAFAQAQGVTLSEAQVAAILAGVPAREPVHEAPDLAQEGSHSGYEGMDFLRVLTASISITSFASIGLVRMFGLSFPLALAGGVVAGIGIMGPMIKGSWTHLRKLMRAANASA